MKTTRSPTKSPKTQNCTSPAILPGQLPLLGELAEASPLVPPGPAADFPAETPPGRVTPGVECAETPPEIRVARRPRTLPAEVYTRDEVDRLIKAASKRAPSGIRNRAMIGLLYSSGLRIAEALALKPADVDRDAGTVRVQRGKGAKSRTVGINATAIALLEQWPDVRRQLGIGSGKPLFCGISKHALGEPVDDSYVRRLLPRLATRAGITKRVHANGLRHTLAVELLREGASPVLIQGVLGHGNLAITNDYLAHLEPREVVDWQRKRAW